MVKLRLARHGRKKQPFYWIISADSRSPRDGKFIEKLGVYNPLSKHINLKMDRVNYWKSIGAQSTERVTKLISLYQSSAQFHS